MSTNIFIGRELKTSKQYADKHGASRFLSCTKYKLIMMKENQNINIKKFNQKDKNKSNPSKLGEKKPP
jgi:hypothetical protein